MATSSLWWYLLNFQKDKWGLGVNVTALSAINQTTSIENFDHQIRVSRKHCSTELNSLLSVIQLDSDPMQEWMF